MPLYEYQCDGTCGQRFEIIRKFSDPPATRCPNCGGAVHKLMSSPAIQFKGSGFYINDYARKDPSSAGKGEDGASSGTAGKDAKDSSDKSEKADKSQTSDKSEKKSSDTTASTSSTPPSSSSATTKSS